MRERGTAHAGAAWVATLLALAGGLAQVGWFMAGGETPARAAAGYVPRQIGYGAFVLAAAGLGAVVLLKAPRRPEMSMVALVLALMGVPLLDSGAGRAASAAGAPMRLVGTVLELGFFLALAATLRLSRSFPYPLPTGRWGRWTPWVLALSVWGAGATGAYTLTPAIGMVMALAVVAVALVNEWAMYRAADREGRRRVLWLAQGMMAFTAVAGLQVALAVLARVTPLRIPIAGWEYWLRLAALFAGLAFLAVAVFYRGALDPALVLRRTTVLGILGVSLVFVFTAVEDVASSWIVERLGLNARAGIWIAGGVVALVIGFLHDRLGQLLRGKDPEGPARS
jgi:hypothetical protein